MVVRKIPEDMIKIPEDWKEIVDTMKQEVVITKENSKHQAVVDSEGRTIAMIMMITVENKTAMVI